MKFSICIPNYNYERYLGITIESVLAQTYPNYEILIADNCSTDGSVALIEKYRQTQANIQLKINKTNLGFAGNLDQVAQMASGEYMIMLSSDDVMKRDALGTYSRLLQLIPSIERPVLTSAIEVIDSNGKVIRKQLANDNHRKIWQSTDIDQILSKELGVTVFKVSSKDLLNRMIINSSNPFNFLTTCYPVSSYEMTGGYTGARMINPDKWFHWRLMLQTDFVYFVDFPYFQYRWHPANQNAQERNAGSLKFLVDEYRTTIELDQKMLSFANLSKVQVQNYFTKNIILKHGMAELSRGYWLKSFRIYSFGWATYPQKMFGNIGYFAIYWLLLMLGPLGTFIVRLAKRKLSQ